MDKSTFQVIAGSIALIFIVVMIVLLSMGIIPFKKSAVITGETPYTAAPYSSKKYTEDHPKWT